MALQLNFTDITGVSLPNAYVVITDILISFTTKRLRIGYQVFRDKDAYDAVPQLQPIRVDVVNVDETTTPNFDAVLGQFVASHADPLTGAQAYLQTAPQFVGSQVVA